MKEKNTGTLLQKIVLPLPFHSKLLLSCAVFRADIGEIIEQEIRVRLTHYFQDFKDC